MNRWRLLAGGPTCGHGESFAPCQAAVPAALEHKRALAMPFGIHAKHRSAILQQNRSRMSQILPCFAIHNDLTVRFCRKVNESNRFGERAFSAEDFRQEEA